MEIPRQAAFGPPVMDGYKLARPTWWRSPRAVSAANMVRACSSRP